VIVGGGNAAGYAARTFVEHGVADGRLCIVTKEVLYCFLLHIEHDQFLCLWLWFYAELMKIGSCPLRASCFNQSLLVPTG